MVEAVEPFKLHSTSMSYLYEVFEHLQLLGMGIWMHIHSVTTTDVSPDLGELAESLGKGGGPDHLRIIVRRHQRRRDDIAIAHAVFASLGGGVGPFLFPLLSSLFSLPVIGHGILEGKYLTIPDLTINPGRMPPFHQKWGCDHV